MAAATPDDPQATQPMSDAEAEMPATYGRFQSRGVLGQGGMGVVLRAWDPELDRDVAIKLLRPGSGTNAPQGAWLQREAQAMAKLSHPNVVTVFETGVIGTTRFIAMELVEGVTLRVWLAKTVQPWPEIVTMFSACGRGLAAAHAAGLVHRDFKPDNVLIGEDGRPRVSDFGLVEAEIAVAREEVTTAAPDRELTVRGATVGTPAYMAPEQWLGKPVDARADQFAFCIALWEAVYGKRPFSGDDTGDLREHVIAGEIDDPADDRGVPRRVELALRRGLDEHAKRWPTMDALLAELAPRRRVTWPWIAAGAAAVAIGGLVIVLAMRSQPVEPCPDPAPQLAGIWDEPTRSKLAAAFTAANPAIANDTLARVTSALDGYTERWRSSVQTACRATHVEGTQSQDQLDRRILCLDRRRAEVASLTQALATADRDRVSRAVDAAGTLGDLDHCANRETLMAQALPTDPAVRSKVEALEAELRATTASKFAGKPVERQARAARVLETARSLGYLPTLVRALDEHTNAAIDNNDDEAAEASLRELALKAAEARDDVLAATAWTDAIGVLAKRHKLEEAKTLEPVAIAAVERAGSSPLLRFDLTMAIGVRLGYAQDHKPAVATLAKAVDMAQSDIQRASAQRALAQAIAAKDGPKNAIAAAEQSLATFERAYGPQHPHVAGGLHLLAQLHLAGGELTKAAAAETRALVIREAALGANHYDVAASLHTLGNIETRRGNNKKARPLFERAIAIRLEIKDVNGAALTRGMLATVVAEDAGIDAARPIFVDALAGLAATTGKDKINYIQTEANFASFLVTAKKCDEAAPLLAHAAATAERVIPRIAPGLLVIGAECDTLANRRAEAIPKYERAIAVCSKVQCPPPIVETASWYLGKALVETGRDRKRGIALIDEAQKLAAEHEVNELVGEIVAWRKTAGL